MSDKLEPHQRLSKLIELETSLAPDASDHYSTSAQEDGLNSGHTKSASQAEVAAVAVAKPIDSDSCLPREAVAMAEVELASLLRLGHPYSLLQS